MNLAIRSELSHGTLTVSISGELDMATAAELRNQLLRGAIQDGVQRVVLDATDLTFMDSTGVGALVHTRQHMPEPVIFELHGVNGAPLRVLEITGLLGIFGLDDSDGTDGGLDDPDGVGGAGGDRMNREAVVQVAARLVSEYRDRVPASDVRAVVEQCGREIDASSDGALPELIERLARQRLSDRV